MGQGWRRNEKRRKSRKEKQGAMKGVKEGKMGKRKTE